jgi:hypothetical protein
MNREELAGGAAAEAERHRAAEIEPARLLVGLGLADSLADTITFGLSECSSDRQEQLGEPIPASEAKQSGESSGALRPPGSPRRASGAPRDDDSSNPARPRPQQLSRTKSGM